MNRVWTKLAGVFLFSLAAGTVASAEAAPPLAWVASQKPSPPAASRAENLVLRALSLMQQKKWGRAARLLETSNQLDPAMGAQAHLAECYEALGRLALAWTTFTEAADYAGLQGLADCAKTARSRAEQLEPRIVLVVLSVPPNVSGTKGLRILLDGVDVDRQKWADGAELALAVDPGRHVVTATAAGKIPWQQPLRVPDAGSRVTVDVPPLVAVKAAASAESGWSAERKAAIAAGSVGAFATTAGIVGLVLLSQDQPSAAVPMAVGGFTLGVPGVVTAIALGATSSKRGRPANPEATSWRIAPAAGPRGAAVVVSGQF